MDDDLFFVPDHGRTLPQTDHHDALRLGCSTAEAMRAAVAGMAAARYDLPTEPPDWTFRHPPWADDLG